MDTTRKTAEDNQHVEGVAKKAQTTWRKIVPTKPNAQTITITIMHFQELNIHKRGKSWR